MQYTIIGDANQCVVTQMVQGDEIRAEIGTMLLLSDGVTLEPSGGAVTQVAALPEVNAPVPLTHFRCMGSTGVVAFAAPYSGETRELPIEGGAWICARESLLFCAREVTATVAFAHAVEAGYFQEEGFVLYRLAGHGQAYIHCGGNVIEYDLAPGQRVSVDAGCAAAFQDTVRFSVEAFAGLPSVHGGSESLFLLTLTGPGRIYLATLPLSRMAQAIKPARSGMTHLPPETGGPGGELLKEL